MLKIERFGIGCHVTADDVEERTQPLAYSLGIEFLQLSQKLFEATRSLAVGQTYAMALAESSSTNCSSVGRASGCCRAVASR